MNTSFVNQEASKISGEKIQFSFGENWKNFASQLTPEAIESAKQSFLEFTQLESLKGHSFFDLGSGSGLSSLVALQAGADRVVSVDIDPNSVECAKALRESQGNDDGRWEKIIQGSALDRELLDSLGQFSFVYSWGVLQHTGAMWESVGNAADCVAPGGYFHLALFRKHISSRYWLRFKQACNRWPRTVRPMLKGAYVSYRMARILSKGRSPFKEVRNYNAKRGMNFFRDIDDWMCGLPYEYASADEVMEFLSKRGFVLEQLKTAPSLGCNEYLLRRSK